MKEIFTLLPAVLLITVIAGALHGTETTAEIKQGWTKVKRDKGNRLIFWLRSATFCWFGVRFAYEFIFLPSIHHKGQTGLIIALSEPKPQRYVVEVYTGAWINNRKPKSTEHVVTLQKSKAKRYDTEHGAKIALGQFRRYGAYPDAKVTPEYQIKVLPPPPPPSRILKEGCTPAPPKNNIIKKHY